MPEYKASDLNIEIDGIALIRRTFGPTMTAQQLVGGLVRDLVLTRSLPLRINFVDPWWVISSQVDWLTESDGSTTLRSFKYVVHLPEAGREACHSEIFLTAYADAVITRGPKDGLIWIAGDQQRTALSEELLRELTHDGCGRAVAFWLDSGP
jgi:hypothetical protein